jgi:molybdate transport system substrate-binding protein
MRLLFAALLLFVAPARAETLLVFAASSTANALKEIAREFQTATGHKVDLSVGSSSDLVRQIKAGARVDLFLSADRAKAEELGLPAEQRVDLLSNQLVVIIPAESKQVVVDPAQLLGIKRLALPDPKSVPLGIYARTWFESQDLWTNLKGRLVPSLDARATLAAVESRNADAGVVYRTDASTSKKVRVVIEVPREAVRIVYPLVLVRPERPAAVQLYEFLKGAAARRIFDKHGFSPVR